MAHSPCFTRLGVAIVRLSPLYVEASEYLAENGKGVMAAIDADFAKDLAAEYKVTSYPTIKYFPAGSDKAEAANLHNKDDLIEFMMKKIDPSWEKPPVGPFVNNPEWGDDSGDVVFMDDDHFDEFKETEDMFFAFFYAPWCGHCKAAKPHFGKASKKALVPFVAMDCTGSGKGTCGKMEVKSYPTLKWFADDDFEDYQGGREEADFVKFAQEKAEAADDHDDDEEAGPGLGSKKEGIEEVEEEEEEEDMRKDEL